MHDAATTTLLRVALPKGRLLDQTLAWMAARGLLRDIV